MTFFVSGFQVQDWVFFCFSSRQIPAWC